MLTGTYGVATLPDTNKEQQELYLHMDGSEKELPVPKLFWKIIYDRKENGGVTIISVNNPYLEDIPNDYIICKDICNRIHWFEVDTNRKDRGYLYCCDMNEFFRATGYENIFQSDKVNKDIPTLEEEEEQSIDEEEVTVTEHESKPDSTDYESVVVESSTTHEEEVNVVVTEHESKPDSTESVVVESSTTHDYDSKSTSSSGFFLSIRHYLSALLSKCRRSCENVDATICRHYLSAFLSKCRRLFKFI